MILTHCANEKPGSGNLNTLWLWVSKETRFSHLISLTQETPSCLKVITNPVKSPHSLNGLFSGRKLWGCRWRGGCYLSECLRSGGFSRSALPWLSWSLKGQRHNCSLNVDVQTLVIPLRWRGIKRAIHVYLAKPDLVYLHSNLTSEHER